VSAAVANVAADASRRGIAVAAVIAVLAAAVVVVFHQSYATIWDLWKLTTYQYAFIVVPGAAYLLWSRRGVLTVQPIAPSWWILLAVFVGGRLHSPVRLLDCHSGFQPAHHLEVVPLIVRLRVQLERQPQVERRADPWAFPFPQFSIDLRLHRNTAQCGAPDRRARGGLDRSRAPPYSRPTSGTSCRVRAARPTIAKAAASARSAERRRGGPT